MQKIRYSKDVDVLLIELSNQAIAYAEQDGQKKVEDVCSEGIIQFLNGAKGLRHPHPLNC